MAFSFAQLLEHLELDSWRKEAGFSSDFQPAHEALIDSKGDSAAIDILRNWIAAHQPCLFGRMTAKADLITFCILRESDLLGDKAKLRDRIQDRRTEWQALAFDGKKSGFVIVVISPRISLAVPDANVQAIASQLCEIYLLRESIAPDQIYLEEVFLERPGTKRTVWKWNAGVNYFCAQGDKRWWQDHRVPGGLAFSVNSVGHLVKSGQLSEALKTFDESLGGPPQSEDNKAVSTLGQALGFAMRTIDRASNAVSGKATMLLPMPEGTPPEPPSCPVSILPKGADYTKYCGWYHTDITLPSEYFIPDIERPASLEQKTLDFTYLFNDDIENPDHITTGKGRRIRDAEGSSPNQRLHRMVAEAVAIKDRPKLVRALEKFMPWRAST